MERAHIEKVIAVRRTTLEWFNNGLIEKSSFDCPEGFTKGRLKKMA